MKLHCLLFRVRKETRVSSHKLNGDLRHAFSSSFQWHLAVLSAIPYGISLQVGIAYCLNERGVSSANFKSWPTIFPNDVSGPGFLFWGYYFWLIYISSLEVPKMVTKIPCMSFKLPIVYGNSFCLLICVYIHLIEWKHEKVLKKYRQEQNFHPKRRLILDSPW